MIEIHAGATPFDGGIFVASCDKAVPAHLMGIGRVNMPSILVTGGVMDAGPDLLTLEQIGKCCAMCQRALIHICDTGLTLVDLPGTYSLRARSSEERVARDFLASGAVSYTHLIRVIRRRIASA